MRTEEIYLAGGCLWGVQEFFRYVPGVLKTEAGRANGSSSALSGPYDGYAECVRTIFDPDQITVGELVACLFEIIDPNSIDQQGPDIGKKYRSGIFSRSPQHLEQAKQFIQTRSDAKQIAIELRPLTNYVRSDKEHQDRLNRDPETPCHLPEELLHRYKRKTE